MGAAADERFGILRRRFGRAADAELDDGSKLENDSAKLEL